MSTASHTKASGMKLGAEPKKIVLLAVLLAVAIGMFFYNSQSGNGGSNSVAQTHSPSTAVAPVATVRAPERARRSNSVRDRGVLRIQPIDPRNGDVDPTLRLDLLARLQSVQPIEGGRSLFDLGPADAASGKPLPPVKIIPKPLLGMNALHPGSVAPAFSIPLKFYGFERLRNKMSGNRGFFLDGDKILVASEGDLLKERYLVVELTPGGAKLEDTQLKKGAVLPLVPEARNEQ